ncbi:hypothetical protein EC973_005231 [Apophysomyces ossiformis]|uniref:Methyltransferase domain-containing protein n=1 Tax=Apophysomyces ossiformis TaxID=679940 RepID=A0A8H7EVH4_9FUNG|nr:hypothetical protein EC973_005231 [Apophysomyces ossiformis]
MPSTASSSSPSLALHPLPRRPSAIDLVNARRKQSVARSQEDLKEFDRLQRQHYLLKSVRKSNLWAPITPGSVVVDVGSGNGVWAFDMANQFSHLQIIGLDIQPPLEQQGTPKNLSYLEADIHQTWPLADNSVDLIFQRNMGPIIHKHQWSHVFNEMFRVLKPGGYIELLESDLWHHNPGPVLQEFDKYFRDYCTELEFDFAFTESLGSQIQDHGFKAIEQREIDIPQFGFINKETQKAFLRNKKSFYLSKWEITSEEYDTAVQQVLEEFEEYHGFQRFHCWIARKP